MAPLKAPGPDGMPPIFFQHFWPLVGDEVIATILQFLNIAMFPCHLNHTFISLIPKVKNLELVSEFRPISLCNVLYKIFSKVLSNRLKKVLPTLIMEHQMSLQRVASSLIMFWLLLRVYIACRITNPKRMDIWQLS